MNSLQLLCAILQFTLFAPIAGLQDNYVSPLFLQDNVSHELNFEVNRMYPPFSVSKAKLNNATSLKDFNRHYKPSWIREFISVKIKALVNGKHKILVGKSDHLSQNQLNLIKMADSGTGIEVEVLYLPENNLKHNEQKTINFTFNIDPDQEASFPGGKQKLLQYLKEKAIDKIPEGTFTGYDLAAVTFVVNENGQLEDVHVFESSKNVKIDNLLLEAVCNMPMWKPAEYADGKKVEQAFALTVGNMENCMTNLLNIYPLGREPE